MAVLLLVLLSFLFFSFGIYRLKGPVSASYLAYGTTVEANYFAVPIGIGLAIWALSVSPLTPDKCKLTVLIIGTVVGLVAAIPARLLLKPRWLRWLENTHGNIMPLLQSEIREEGLSNWDRRINTQIELEQWVIEVRRKYGW